MRPVTRCQDRSSERFPSLTTCMLPGHVDRAVARSGSELSNPLRGPGGYARPKISPVSAISSRKCGVRR